ncbi:competence protein CoiA family protein [Streptomyces sp. NPDC014846]|uniref:competence protein CoiA family protein n=1 Tax=Streptomyces sp. NPDC014846 TaxID=3364922 RepID=UPI0036FD76A8
MQTAVLGHTESEDPVVLPMRAAEVAAFRQVHASATFWCGRWLGGCGGRLMVKTYQDRVCHFAHVPDSERGPCRRASVGVASADHLYIKQQILTWLAAQSIPARAVLPEDGARLGAEVLFEPGGHGCLRMLLDTQAALAPAAEGTQLILGPQVAHDPMRLAVDGYVLRIRCDSGPAGRRVMIGTQTQAGGIRWFGLEECSLKPWGLSTPAVEEVRRLRGTVRRIGSAVSRVPASRTERQDRPVAAFQARDDRTEAFTALQQAIEQGGGGRSSSVLRHCLTHAEAAARGGASAEENELLRRAADLLLRTERGVGASAPPASTNRQPGRLSPRAPRTAKSSASPGRKAAEAVTELLDTLNRRRGHFLPGEQQRLVARLQDKAGPATPYLSKRIREQVTYWRQHTGQAPPEPRKPPAPTLSLPSAAVLSPPATPTPRAKGRPEPKKHRRETLPAHPRDLDLVADAARDVLEHAARLGKTLPFEQLCAQAKGLQGLSSEQQRRVLRTACSRSRAGMALAALLTTGRGEPHPPYRHLARQPDTGADWHRAVADVHACYRPGPPPPGARPTAT